MPLKREHESLEKKINRGYDLAQSKMPQVDCQIQKAGQANDLGFVSGKKINK